jgi:glutamine synthetase
MITHVCMNHFLSNRMKHILEYVWIDANGGMRSKTRVADLESDRVKCILTDSGRWEWSFDGSSTGQATGTDSDVLIRPVAIYPNPFYNIPSSTFGQRAFLVLCDCYNKDGTPHATNARVQCAQTETACAAEEPIFGIEQEYVLYDRAKEAPYQWASAADPGCGGQGPYYCGVGGDRCFGRKIVDQHLHACLHAGIEICGTNAEVMASQWEFQIGPLPATQVSDQLWMARYILLRITEEHGCCATFHPKPMRTWNGSGGHTNFSTAAMRAERAESTAAMRGSKPDSNDAIDAIMDACTKLQAKHAEHMAVYGRDNAERMTGLHETSSMHECTWGVSDRGRSIRIPRHVANQGHGYLEDRRPAANLDPYLVTERIMRTTCCLDLDTTPHTSHALLCTMK